MARGSNQNALGRNQARIDRSSLDVNSHNVILGPSGQDSRFTSSVDLTDCSYPLDLGMVALSPFMTRSSCTVNIGSGSGPYHDAPSPTGTVAFSEKSVDGGNLLMSESSCVVSSTGYCSINFTGSSTGTVELRASYSGDANYLPSSADINIPIVKNNVATNENCGYLSGTSTVQCWFEVEGIEFYGYQEPRYPTGTISISSSEGSFSPSSCSLDGGSEYQTCYFDNTTDLGPSYLTPCYLAACTLSVTYSGDSNYYGTSVQFWVFGPEVYPCFSDFVEIGKTFSCNLFDKNVTQSGGSGSVAISCGYGYCNVTGINPGPVILQETYSCGTCVTLVSSATTPVLKQLIPVLVDCVPGANQSETNCKATEELYALGTLTWTSTSPTGSFSQTSCQLGSARSCEVEYTDTSLGFAEIVASFSGPNAFPSSGTVTVATGKVQNTSSVATNITSVGNTTEDSAFNSQPSQSTVLSSQSCSVTFQEAGLKSGTPWSVNLGGKSGSSTGNAITFPVSSGSSYPFSISNVVGSIAAQVSTTAVTSANLHGNGTVKLTVYRPLPTSGDVSSSGCGGAVYVYFYSLKYSCKIGVSLATSSTTTTSSTRAVLSTCSDIIPLKITSGNIDASQFSNIAIGSDGQSAYDLSFTLIGKSGTFGTSTISVPKNDVPNGLVPVVYVNGTRAGTQSYTEDANYYYVTFTTHFSTDSIDVLFSSSSTSNVCCTPPPPGPTTLLPYITVGIIVVVILGTSLFLVSKRRANSSPTALSKRASCPNCGAPIDSNFAFCRKCGKRLDQGV
ncbi:MAG TPA: Ig-like domain repeat protein [Nitrososphaerales archaeon]|nr:Ig-like domain repeat protein [Nitrososphaerales archaeon]